MKVKTEVIVGTSGRSDTHLYLIALENARLNSIMLDKML